MGLLKLKTKTTVEDYLAAERESAVRHEYVEGQIYATAGASDNHGRIVINLTTALSLHLRDSRCEPFAGETKVQVTRNVYYYPDLLVSCEENPASPYFRNEPVLVVEVTSPSTERVDRSEKPLFYRQMPSLREYAVIDQQRAHVELHRPQPDGGWITYFFDASDDEVEFASVGMTLPIAEIYRRVRFETNAERTE